MCPVYIQVQLLIDENLIRGSLFEGTNTSALKYCSVLLSEAFGKLFNPHLNMRNSMAYTNKQILFSMQRSPMILY